MLLFERKFKLHKAGQNYMAQHVCLRFQTEM